MSSSLIPIRRISIGYIVSEIVKNLSMLSITYRLGLSNTNGYKIVTFYDNL